MLNLPLTRRAPMISKKLQIPASASRIIILDNIDMLLTFGRTHIAANKTLTKRSRGSCENSLMARNVKPFCSGKITLKLKTLT